MPVPQLPLVVWEQIAGHCKAHEWATSAGMACKALQAVQPARLEVSSLGLKCSGSHVRRVHMALKWTAEHWRLAETLKLKLHCSREMLDADTSVKDLAHVVLDTCMSAPEPVRMRALQLSSRMLTALLGEQPSRLLELSLCIWLVFMRQLRLLSIDFLPVPEGLQQMRQLRHLSLIHQYLKQDALEALLAALPGSLQTLELPRVQQSWARGGGGPIDLTRFIQLTHMVCADACTELRLPSRCRRHTTVYDAGLLLQLDLLCIVRRGSPLVQSTSAQTFCTWQENERVIGEFLAVLKRMPKLDTLQLLVSCRADDHGDDGSDDEAPAQPPTTAVLQLPGSFYWCAPALTSLTVALRRTPKNGRLDGHLQLTVPASMMLRELVVHARLMTLEFEDVQQSTADLNIMRLIYLERSGIAQSALKEVFVQRGLRLELCHLNAHSYDPCDDEPVQYTCMYTVGCNGAKPRDVTEVPCVCGACYECVLSRPGFHLE